MGGLGKGRDWGWTQGKLLSRRGEGNLENRLSRVNASREVGRMDLDRMDGWLDPRFPRV